MLAAQAGLAQAEKFTIEQALSAPFGSDLRAAPAGKKMAWLANIDGKRNIWVAEPAASGSGFTSGQITNYSQDDGQELSAPQWTPDAASIVYVRSGRVQGETHPVPNPAWSTQGEKQQVWVVSASGGEPRLLGEGRGPAVSPDGKAVAYVLKGQVWTVRLDAANAKPEQLLVARGSA
jgi:Tol biopolymer transport system component